jgi:hypothetical protein
VRIQPPLQWKGGVLVELFKGKGSPSLCGNYRDILLADDQGKGISRIIRKRFMKLAMNLSHDTQYGGGLNGGETAFAQLYVRLVIDYAVNTSTSCSTLYLDVVAAFATMLRRVIFDVDSGDEAWLASLKRAGFSDDDIGHIYSHICDHDWLHSHIATCGVEDPASSELMDFRMAEQMYNNTWVSQEYIPNVILTTKGSGAGTPLADLLYSLCMSRVISLLRTSMEIDKIDSHMNVCDESFAVSDVSFVDDLAIPILAPANLLCTKISMVANCAYRVFSSYGMVLNFLPGKSECTIGFYGKDSKHIAREFASHPPVIPISAGEFKELRVVKTYQHVGTLSSISHHMGDEVARRNGIMREESRFLCKKFLRVKSISIAHKISAVQAYVFSKGLFQCSTWPRLDDTQYKRFHSNILRIYRDATGTYYKVIPANESGSSELTVDTASLFNDDDVIFQHKLICPMTMLRYARLSLFFRIVRKAPPNLLNIMVAQCGSNYKKGWAFSVLSDLSWLCQSEDFASCKNFNVDQWLSFLSDNDHFKCFSMMRKFCKTPWANVMSQWAITPTLSTFAMPMVCPLCSVSSKSLQAHSVHLARKHGIKSSLRRYVDSSVCGVCLVNFISRERCLNHVRYRSKVCKVNTLLRGPWISQDQATQLDEQELESNRKLYAGGKRRHHVRLPCFRMQGPLLPILNSHHSDHSAMGYGHNYF